MNISLLRKINDVEASFGALDNKSPVVFTKSELIREAQAITSRTMSARDKAIIAELALRYARSK